MGPVGLQPSAGAGLCSIHSSRQQPVLHSRSASRCRNQAHSHPAATGSRWAFALACWPSPFTNDHVLPLWGLKIGMGNFLVFWLACWPTPSKKDLLLRVTLGTQVGDSHDFQPLQNVSETFLGRMGNRKKSGSCLSDICEILRKGVSSVMNLRSYQARSG